jgi:amino acid transporter
MLLSEANAGYCYCTDFECTWEAKFMSTVSNHGRHRLIEHADNGASQNTMASEPRRRLVFIDGVAILVGIMIGSGIFSSPGLALERSGSPALVLLAWSLSGLLVMLESFCYVELGAMMPSAGGDYDYLLRAFGDETAFSFAWYNFFVGKTGAQAIIATIFGRYFYAVLEGSAASINNDVMSSQESLSSKLIGAALIISVTAMNCAGIKESAILSLVLSSVKVLLIGAVVVVSCAYIASPDGDAAVARMNFSPSTSFDGSHGWLGFGSSLVACLWCFDGFADINFLQEELISPITDLPKIIRSGLLIVTACYITVNIAYLLVLSTEDIVHSNAIAVLFGTRVSALFPGNHGHGQGILPTIMALGVALSTAGSINGSIMTGGRAFYAVARNGKAPSIVAHLNRYGAPWVALVAQGTWASCLLLLPGSNFASLLDYFGPCSWVFYALTATALIVLRTREPHADRPFRVPLYPLPPLLVILMAVGIVISALQSRPLYTAFAFIFVVLSFPVYKIAAKYNFWEARSSSEDDNSAHSSIVSATQPATSLFKYSKARNADDFDEVTL